MTDTVRTEATSAPDDPAGADDAATPGVDEVLGREVALVALPPASGAALEARVAAVRRLAGLHHPHLPEVFDVDGLEPGAESVLVLERVPGRTLGELRGEGPLPLDRVAAIGAGVASALAHAHDHGVVHGRLGPASIVVDDERHVWLVGLTAGMRPEAADAPAPEPADDVRALTGILRDAVGPDEAEPLAAALADVPAGGAADLSSRLLRLVRGAEPTASGTAAPGEATAGEATAEVTTGEVTAGGVTTGGVTTAGPAGESAPTDADPEAVTVSGLTPTAANDSSTSPTGPLAALLAPILPAGAAGSDARRRRRALLVAAAVAAAVVLLTAGLLVGGGPDAPPVAGPPAPVPGPAGLAAGPVPPAPGAVRGVGADVGGSGEGRSTRVTGRTGQRSASDAPTTTAAPDVTGPGTAPGASGSRGTGAAGTTGPGSVTPTAGATAAETAAPDPTGADSTSPGSTSPDSTSPGSTSPESTSPGSTSPEPTSPPSSDPSSPDGGSGSAEPSSAPDSGGAASAGAGDGSSSAGDAAASSTAA